MRRIFLFTLIILMVSCKKKDINIHLRGAIYDPNQNLYISGASVILQSSNVQTGVYNAGYSDLATTITDGSGKFSMDFNSSHTVGYKLIVNKDNYFYSETNVDPQLWSGGNTYYPVYNIYAQAYIKLTIINANPVNQNDEVNYYLKNAGSVCTGCCPDSIRTGSGMFFTAVYKCLTQGATKVTVHWDYTKGPNPDIARDVEVYCAPFDTTFYKIEY